MELEDAGGGDVGVVGGGDGGDIVFFLFLLSLALLSLRLALLTLRWLVALTLSGGDGGGGGVLLLGFVAGWEGLLLWGTLTGGELVALSLLGWSAGALSACCCRG